MRKEFDTGSQGDTRETLFGHAKDYGIPESDVEAAVDRVNFHAHRLSANSHLSEDALQSGYVGLLKALPRFDPRRQICFCSFADKYIAGEIVRTIRGNRLVNHGPAGELSLLDLVESAEPSPFIASQTAAAQDAVRQFVDSLPVRLRHVVRRMFWDGVSQTEVARELDVSKMAISKMLAKLRAKGRTALSAYNLKYLTN
ncbi:MAG: sigma-70 family RNA polymerase sigma factor [Planctomycetota bacterium]|jgi:RNA polymerase sigma factor (sigma-70 family)